jgi:uncharacterized alkaline shock family protein YloU
MSQFNTVSGPGSTALETRSEGHELVTTQGKTSIADSVVSKIAGIAAREVAGVHDMGKGAARAFGALKEKLPVGSSSPSVTQGVSVEVGERQAAIDLDLVCDYGVPIADVTQAVRDNVIDRVQRMTGLEVTEVNITVDDVYLGEDDGDSRPSEPPRVQ